MIYKRDRMVDTRMKYTAKEIAEYNLRAWKNFVCGMNVCVSRNNNWVPPDISKVK